VKVKNIKWRNVFETIRSEILLGKFDVRERFPSEVQLCRRFGVSRPTVRLALDELKRTDILEARPGSGTYLSDMARNLTGHLGLIVPGIASGEIFPPICAEIARYAREAGYTLIFGDASSKDPKVRARQAIDLARQYADERVAGVFLEPIELVPGAAETTEKILTILSDHNMPVVLLDRDVVPPPDRSGYDLVGIDNVQAGYRLARHLIDCGARRICFFMRVGSAPTVSLRIQGARGAVLDAGLPWASASVCVAEIGDAEPIKKLVGGRCLPDAFICGNDATAAALLQTLNSLGKQVPRDFLLAGFDDVKIATLTSPPLTTIRQPCDLIARAAVDTLLTRLRDPSLPPREVLLDVSLVVRHSTVSRVCADQRFRAGRNPIPL
jgi:LacI family transcriptional regulator